MLFGGTGYSGLRNDTWTLNATPAPRLAFTHQPPTSAMVGVPFTAQVQLEDASGKPVGRSGVTVQLSAVGGDSQLTCSSNPQSTDAKGVAAFQCSFGHPGTYTLYATATGLRQTSSNPITARDRVVFLLQGIATHLSSDNVAHSTDDTFASNDRIRHYIQSDPNWTNIPFVEYSYMGITGDDAGCASECWTPKPYGCDDTFDASISDDVTRLDKQVSVYLAAFPRSPQFPMGGRLAGLVTLDSPVGGIPPLSFLDKLEGLYHWACLDPLSITFADFNDMVNIWNTGKGQPIGATRSTEKALFGKGTVNQTLARSATRTLGVRVLTVENTLDAVWGYCNPLVGTHPGQAPVYLSTQTLTDGGTASGVYALSISAKVSDCTKGIQNTIKACLTDGIVKCVLEKGTDVSTAIHYVLDSHGKVLSDCTTKQKTLTVFKETAKDSSSLPSC